MEAGKRCEIDRIEADKRHEYRYLEPAKFAVPPGRLGAAERLERFEQLCAAMVTEDGTASSDGVTSSDELSSGVGDSGSDPDAEVELSPHQLASGGVKDSTEILFGKSGSV
jgi:hypothetical protein